MADEIDALLRQVLVDTEDDDEALNAFTYAFEDLARLPFTASIVGVEVQVMAVDYQGWERQGLSAVCRRNGQLHRVGLLDLTPVEPLDRSTRQMLDAYRRWIGAPPLPAPTPTSPPWTYPRFAAIRTFGIDEPLRLTPYGFWEPDDEYWGEPGEETRHPLITEIIAHGARPMFEMEQVIPGEDPNNWDDDPITEAADLLRGGHRKRAVDLLERLIERDPRCVDAWVHLGLAEFEHRGPGPARRFYEFGVAAAETALPNGFNGVLPRTLVDNRPFRRALHGLGLCAWRQRRWDEAASIFESLVWTDPSRSWDALWCLEEVRAHHRWVNDDAE